MGRDREWGINRIGVALTVVSLFLGANAFACTNGIDEVLAYVLALKTQSTDKGQVAQVTIKYREDPKHSELTTKILPICPSVTEPTRSLLMSALKPSTDTNLRRHVGVCLSVPPCIATASVSRGDGPVRLRAPDKKAPVNTN